VSGFFALSFLTSLFGGDAWQGFVYPNKNDLSFHLEIGQFDTLEQCRASAASIASAAGWGSQATWECGLNCHPPVSEDDFWICEETSE
jgi:hypothetical protein